MKKLLLLLCTLLGTAGAWAVTNVTVIDKAQDATTYGALSGTTFTTNAASGMADVTIDGIIGTTATNFAYGACLALTSSSSGTITMTAPQGYVIMGYTLTARSNTYRVSYTLTPSAGGSSVTTSTGGVELTASGLDAQTASFTYSASEANSFFIPSMTITVGTAADVEFYQAQLAAYEKAQAFPELIMTAQTKYMSSTNLWASDAADSSEGCLECLTDGNTGTYFHSDWHGSFTGGTHYMDATLPEAVNKIHLYYVTRSTGTGCPTQITVSGSNDGTTWTDNIATLSGSDMPTSASKAYFSEGITFANSYSHLRFYVPKTNSGSNSWFCLAEANLYSATDATMEAMTLSHVAAINLTSAQISRINALDTQLRSTVVNVTYELYESDGTTLVTSTTVEQLKNSAVDVPASLKTNEYYFTFSTVGTIGTSDCTIKVTRTLKSGIVYPYTNISNNKAYYIRTNQDKRNALSTYTDEGTTYLASPVKSALGISAKKFAIISYENNYYLYSVDDEAFVTYTSRFLAPLASKVTGTSDCVTFAQTTTPLYELMFNGSTSLIINSSAAYTYGITIEGWGDTSNEWDDGCQYTIEEAGDFDPTAALASLAEVFHPSYTVTYIVKDASNNTLFTSDPIGTTSGATITTLPEEYQMSAFYTYNTVNVTISHSGNTNVTFTATPKADAPIKYTANASNPYYYNLNIRSKYLVYNAEATGEVTLQDTSEPFNANASWAFIGNPYNFKVINKAKGTSNYLTYTSVVTGRHSDNNIQFVADANFTNQYWIVDTNNNGIVLRMKENPSIYFHHDNNHNYLRTCSVGEWGSVHNDAGSTIVAATDEAVLVALYNEVKDFSFGSAIGQITVEGMTAAAATNAVSAAGTALANQTTSQYESAYNNLKNIVTNMSLNEPAAGFYRLKNVVTGKYLTITDPTTGYNNTEVKGVYANGDANSAATIIKLFDKDGNGKLYMYNQGYGFGWVGYGVYSGNVWATFNPDKYVHWFPGKAANQIAFAICLGNGEGNYASYLTKGIFTADTEDQSVIAGTDYTADAALWVVEPVNAPIEGDINADGAINAADVNVLVDVILGKKNAASYNMDASATYGLSDVTNQVNKYKK